jgi:hypothetical protein
MLLVPSRFCPPPCDRPEICLNVRRTLKPQTHCSVGFAPDHRFSPGTLKNTIEDKTKKSKYWKQSTHPYFKPIDTIKRDCNSTKLHTKYYLFYALQRMKQLKNGCTTFLSVEIVFKRINDVENCVVCGFLDCNPWPVNCNRVCFYCWQRTSIFLNN